MASRESRELRKTFVNFGENLNIPLDKQRKDWEDYAATVELPESIHIEKKNIENVYTEWVSTDDSKKEQVIIHLHGGGYEQGSCLTHRPFASSIALTTGRTVILVDYSLAPENPFPTAIEETVKVYQWLCKNHTAPENIVIGGDSAGGGLTLSTLLALRDKGETLPASAFIISPWTDMTLEGESYRSRLDLDPLVSKESLKICAKRYLGDDTEPTNPLASPALADMTGLPPILIHVGDHEIMLSDSTLVYENGKKSNVDVTLKVWDEMWHVWHAYPVPEAEEALEDIAAFVETHLG